MIKLGFDKFLGAFHLNLPMGGSAYGISNHVITPLFSIPVVIPLEVFNCYSLSANRKFAKNIAIKNIYK